MSSYFVTTNEASFILQSGGELENDERVANIISKLVRLTNNVDPKAFPSHESFDKISIKYKDHCYVICLSNKKIHVVKRKLPQQTTTVVVEQQPIIDT